MINQDQIKEYVYSFEGPAELDFFTDKQKQSLDKERTKFTKTQEYLKAVSDNPALGSKLDQDIATGVIYSQGEMNKIEKRAKALEGMGDREFPNRSLVSPTGQRIIMSKHLSDHLGFLTDGYILADELDELVLGLKSEGILDNQIAKTTDAMKKYNAIILQRGGFTDLSDLLGEVAEYDMSRVKPHFESQSHGASLESLKNVVKESEAPKSSNFTKELKKELRTPELKSFSEAKLPPPPVRKLEPPRVPAKPVMSAPRGDLQSIASVKTVDDLKKIEVAHLRQADLDSQTDLIRSKVMKLAQVNKLLPFYTVNAFEQSPLFKTYLMIGSNLISDPNPNRAQAFERASSIAGSEKLTMFEFEAIADLRKEIEQL